jgi:hypothetical protein
MLFRTNTGELVEINKFDFVNDKLYYKKIMEIKKQIIKNNKTSNLAKFSPFSKLEKTFDNKNN